MKRVKETNFTTRVYQYGIVPLDAFPKEGIDELFKANRLRNKLVEHERNSRDKYFQALCNADKTYALLFKKNEKLNLEIQSAKNNKANARMKATTRDASHPLIKEANEKIRVLEQTRSKLYKELKEARKVADKIIDKKALNDEFFSTINELARVGNNNGIGCRNADEIKQYFKTSWRQTLKDPKAQLRYHTFDGSGFFQFRFRETGSNTDGVPFEWFFIRDENDQRPFVFLSEDRSRKKPRLRLRIKVAGGRSVSSITYMNFDLILHRPIPKNAQIQNGKLVRKRVGDKFSHTVSLTVREPKNGSARLKKKAIGVDIGFRKSGGKIRAAAIASSDPKDPVEYIDVSETFLKRIEHINSIKSKLDESAIPFSKTIKPLLKKWLNLNENHERYNFFKKIVNFPSNKNFPFELAYKLSRWVVTRGRDELPTKIETECIKWWKQHSLNYREQHNLRDKAYKERNDHYKNIASELIKKRQPIAIEKIDLSTFAEVKDKDNELSDQARSNRFLVAPSELIGAIKNAGQREGVPVKEVNPANTSKTCSECGVINEELGAESNWTCPSCNAEHDRDHNASINIARRGEEELKKTNEKTK